MVKLGEVAIVTPLQWRETRVSQQIVLMLTLPEKNWHLKFWPQFENLVNNWLFQSKWTAKIVVQCHPMLVFQ